MRLASMLQRDRGLSGILSHREAARRAGISAQHLCDIEAGRRDPSRRVLRSLQMLYGTDERRSDLEFFTLGIVPPYLVEADAERRLMASVYFREWMEEQSFALMHAKEQP